MGAMVLLIVQYARTSTSGQGASPIAIAGLVVVLVFFLIAWLALWQMFPAIRTSSQGIEVRLFWFWWRSVPWDDVVEVSPWRAAGRRLLVVVVNRLTWFHRVYGIVYGESVRPAFLISEGIAHCDELLRTIRLHAGRKLTA
jgi:hypothetical protein